MNRAGMRRQRRQGRLAAQESHHVYQTSAQNDIDSAAIAQKSVHSRQQHSSVLPKNHRVAATTKQQRRKNTRYVKGY